MEFFNQSMRLLLSAWLELPVCLSGPPVEPSLSSPTETPVYGELIFLEVHVMFFRSSQERHSHTLQSVNYTPFTTDQWRHLLINQASSDWMEPLKKGQMATIRVGLSATGSDPLPVPRGQFSDLSRRMPHHRAGKTTCDALADIRCHNTFINLP